MSEPTPAAYRRAIRHQYSKQGEDIGVVGILDELEQAEAQLGEAVLAFEEIKLEDGKVCGSYATCDHEACASSYNAWAVADAFLAGLSEKGATDTPEECVRVTVTPVAGPRFRFYKCNPHGCPWPDKEGPCPMAEDEHSNRLSSAQDAVPWSPALGEYK